MRIRKKIIIKMKMQRCKTMIIQMKMILMEMMMVPAHITVKMENQISRIKVMMIARKRMMVISLPPRKYRENLMMRRIRKFKKSKMKHLGRKSENKN